MDTKELLTGRYEIRLRSNREKRPITVDRTDCELCAKVKARAINAEAYDTTLNRVFSPHTGTWLRPETQAVIEGEFAKTDQDFLAIAKAISRDILEVFNR